MALPVPKFEVCVDNIESFCNAIRGGADRIELCTALSEGGLTPSIGFLRVAKNLALDDFPIFPMIRPRGGGFVYDEDEIDIMEMDIRDLKEAGANGFVFGLLTKENKVDVDNCRRLLEAASPLPVTFHRAFDEIKSVPEQLEALKTIGELGFSRLLTSGGAVSAEEGISVIACLREQSVDTLSVMPGGGLTRRNLLSILHGCQPKEFHGSAKGPSRSDGLTVSCSVVVKMMKAEAKKYAANTAL